MLAGVIQTTSHTFAEDVPFELRKHGKQSGHRATGWCSQIERLGERYETDSEMLKLLQRRNQVGDGAAPPIQVPYQHYIDCAAASSSDQVARSARCDAPEPTSFICAAMTQSRLAAYSRMVRICSGRVC